MIQNGIKIFFLSFMIISFVSCGYKPGAKYARKTLGEKISTNIKISLVDPQNTVLIKDALDEAIIKVFHASLVPREEATIHLDMELKNVKYDPLAFDENGYVIAYRTTTYLRIKTTKNGLVKIYNTKGTYDFSIAANTVITDNERYKAIQESAIKAIKSFMAQVMSQGVGNGIE
ncbi:Probable lipoprotein Cj1090c [hydrothermal vent metagenome]|uniref:Probable lipoprotein Cj1090c n=1 Tax=hydrothermal vent metagenome TaxID=652676 RepID=A0A1W1D2N3_9ZZZZ